MESCITARCLWNPGFRCSGLRRRHKRISSYAVHPIPGSVTPGLSCQLPDHPCGAASCAHRPYGRRSCPVLRIFRSSCFFQTVQKENRKNTFRLPQGKLGAHKIRALRQTGPPGSDITVHFDCFLIHFLLFIQIGILYYSPAK